MCDVLTIPEVLAMDRAAAGLLHSSQDATVLTLCGHVRRLCAAVQRPRTIAATADQLKGGDRHLPARAG